MSQPTSASPLRRSSVEAPSREPVQRDVASERGGLPGTLLSIQRVAGNRAVVALLGAGAPPQPAADPLEREADQVAGQLLGVSPSSDGPGADDPGESGLDYLSHDGSDAVPDVAGEVSAARPGGRPLPAGVRAAFEPAFGADLGHVRGTRTRRRTG